MKATHATHATYNPLTEVHYKSLMTYTPLKGVSREWVKMTKSHSRRPLRTIGMNRQGLASLAAVNNFQELRFA